MPSCAIDGAKTPGGGLRLRGLTRFTAALAALSAAGCVGSGTAAPDTVSTTTDGRALLERACTSCHDLGGLEGFKGYWGEPQWRDMVATMRDHGAVLSDVEADVLVAWLTAEYGPGSD
jgi:hypothetical protein